MTSDHIKAKIAALVKSSGWSGTTKTPEPPLLKRAATTPNTLVVIQSINGSFAIVKETATGTLWRVFLGERVEKRLRIICNQRRLQSPIGIELRSYLRPGGRGMEWEALL